MGDEMLQARLTVRLRGTSARVPDLVAAGTAVGAVVESLERLDDAQRSLAIMLFVDGLSQGEAAEELGMSRVTINKRAQDIRAQLRISHTPSSSDMRSSKEART